jgi:murein DD-endopeptidase MepM/ murein hydrolase activator NlpD
MSEIKNSRENKERLLTKKLTRQEILQQELKELQQTAEELASLIEVLRTKDKQELAKEKQARLEKQLSGHSPILPHSLPWPIQGKVLTKYGRQQNAQLGAPFFSNGIVIGLDASSPVMAVADGKVLYAGQFMSYGAMTVLEHPGDWYTVYGYLSGWDVEKGQEIKKGQKIGTSRIKTKGGAETYFELRFYGKPTDPLPWLNQ